MLGGINIEIHRYLFCSAHLHLLPNNLLMSYAEKLGEGEWGRPPNVTDCRTRKLCRIIGKESTNIDIESS